MLVRLTKTSEYWVVEFESSNGEPDYQHFSNIENASHFMVKYLNVKDDAIDDAIIEMAGYDKSKAIFDDRGELQETR